jgi:hypothetical protein
MVLAQLGRVAPREGEGVFRSLTSLRANGSRECAPDDGLREAIHASLLLDGLLRRYASRNDGTDVLRSGCLKFESDVDVNAPHSRRPCARAQGPTIAGKSGCTKSSNSCGRPQWTSSQSINRIMRRTGEKALRSSLLPRPFRWPFFGKRLRSLDIILRRHHRLDRGIFTLFGDRLLQRHREPLLNRLLGGADRHR